MTTSDVVVASLPAKEANLAKQPPFPHPLDPFVGDQDAHRKSREEIAESKTLVTYSPFQCLCFDNSVCDRDCETPKLWQAAALSCQSRIRPLWARR